VRVRSWADDPGRQQIDGYLIDWYCVALCACRSPAGLPCGSYRGVTRSTAVAIAAAKMLQEIGRSLIEPAWYRVRLMNLHAPRSTGRSHGSERALTGCDVVLGLRRRSVSVRMSDKVFCV
jgi:hypothetical protein